MKSLFVHLVKTLRIPTFDIKLLRFCPLYHKADGWIIFLDGLDFCFQLLKYLKEFQIVNYQNLIFDIHYKFKYHILTVSISLKEVAWVKIFKF